MKKVSFLTILLTVLLCTTGCNNEPNMSEVTQIIQGLSSNTMLNGDLFYEGHDTSVKVHVLAQDGTVSMDLTIGNVKYAEHMPAINITLDKVNATLYDSNRGTFTGTGSYTPVTGYTIKDVSGSFDLYHRTLYMTYTVETSAGTYKVLTFPADMRSMLIDQAGYTFDNYETTTMKFYRFIESAVSPATFDMYMYNVKFTEQMPVQRRLHFPLSGDNVTVKATTTGYTITGTGIIPLYLDGSTEVPMASRTVDNLVLNINTIAKTFDVAFDCYGLHYTDNGKLL